MPMSGVGSQNRRPWVETASTPVRVLPFIDGSSTDHTAARSLGPSDADAQTPRQRGRTLEHAQVYTICWPVFKPQRHDFSEFLVFGIRVSFPLFRFPCPLPTVRRNAFGQVFDHLRRSASTEVLVVLPFARRALDVS
jgi:hypothetical protein